MTVILKLPIRISRNPVRRDKEFGIHRSFLVHYSSFFRSAFSSPKTTKLELEDIDSDVFARFVHWLYYQSIGDIGNSPNSLIELFKLWALAEKFKVIRLQDSAMDILCDLLVETVDEPGCEYLEWRDIFQTAYRSHSDVLGRLLRDVMVAMKDGTKFGLMMKCAPLEVVHEVARLVKRCHVSKQDIPVRLAADYYVYTEVARIEDDYDDELA